MTSRTACDICVALGTGTCVNNQTCQCYQGHLGTSCQDPATTAASFPLINIPIIIASVLGSILCTLIIGLIIFFVWKRRVKKKSYRLSATNSTATTIPSSEPVVAPALYDLSLSRQDSNPTMSYHLYDELP